MAINIDNAPNNNPAGGPPPGRYLCEILETKMQNSKNNVTKPPWLVVKLKLTNKDGDQYEFEDKFFESTSSYVLFKIKRFIMVNGLEVSGSFELKDLQKIIVPGTKFVTNITESEYNYNGKTTMQAQVDIFDKFIYYPLSEWEHDVPEESNDVADASGEDTPDNRQY